MLYNLEQIISLNPAQLGIIQSKDNILAFALPVNRWKLSTQPVTLSMAEKIPQNSNLKASHCALLQNRLARVTPKSHIRCHISLW